MINQYTTLQDRMRHWDKKLYRLEDELLIYIVQRATYLLERRSENETS